MRIALVTPGYSASDEDWCIPALQDLACRLGERHQVHVFATTYPHRRDHYEVKGISVSSLGDGKTGRLAFMRRMRRTMVAIESAHQDAPFDVLHGFFADQGGVVTILAARRLSIPCIVTAMAGELTYDESIRYGNRRRLIAGRLARFGARHSGVLLVNSPYHAGRLQNEQPTLEPQVIPLGTDTERFGRAGRTQELVGDIPILSVASLTPVKGHTVILDAFASTAVQGAGLHLHIVGSGISEQALRRRAEELGISGSVTFHGHIEHHQLPPYYRGARFCVLSSYFESHAMVLLEAAACGRVTIGSRVGSMPDFCAAEFLNNPGDAAALAATMRRLAMDRDLCSRLGRDAEETVVNGYTLAQSADALESLYRHVRSAS